MEEILLERHGSARRTSAARLRSATAIALEQQWAGWSELLARATDVAAHGPAPGDEPSDTSLSLQVRRDERGNPPGWVWEFTVPWIDTDGREIGVRLWNGRAPAEALREALAEAREWYRPILAEPFDAQAERGSHGGGAS